MKQKQLYKELNKQISQLLIIGIFILGVALQVLGSTAFFTGFHNLDLGQNLNSINKDLGLVIQNSSSVGYVDIGNDGIRRTGTELYILGVNQMQQGYRFLISSMLVLFVLALGLILEKKW